MMIHPETEDPAVVAAAEPQSAAEQQSAADTPLMTATGEFSPDWYRRFTELEPYAASLAKFRRPEALAKSYAHLERLRGYPEQGDERRMAAFRMAMGLPDSADAYSLPRPEDAPDELWDPALAKSMAQVAYEYGVPPRAMEALCTRYAEEGRRHLEQAEQATQAAIEAADAGLQREWGEEYESNMNRIGAFLEQMGRQSGVDVAELVQNPALRANPDFAKLMLAAAALTEEAPLRGETRSDNSRQEAQRIARDPSHPLHEAYMRTNHPQHRYANEQYDRLAFGREL